MRENISNTQRYPKNAGFTLIELLVVMSIISMLMSMMLPALSKAREQGKRVVCLSNLRQLTFGWMIYATNNDDKLCSADTNWDVPPPPGIHWVVDGPAVPGNPIGGTKYAIKYGLLWPYVSENLDLYKCKSDSSELLRSYSLSRTMNGKTCNCEHDNINPFRIISEITRPGERMVFIDADTRIDWIEGSFCAVKQIDAVVPEWYLRNSRNITARHDNGCNVSFADGHCDYWKYKDLRTAKLANWQIDPNEASVNNQDLDYMVQLLKGR